MKNLICRSLNERGQIKISSEPLGKGGEGSVYDVQASTLNGILPAEELVAKIYHDPSEGDRENKIQAMIESSPESDSVAWPLASVFDEAGIFQGYVMHKLPAKNYRTWAELSNLGSRRRTSPKFDLRYAITSCRNLAVALHSIHAAGHCVGDVNESNILVGSDARVMIIDTDSAQIKGEGNEIFPCPVGKPEYTASELTHGSLKKQTRTRESDIFAYSVAVFQMMTGGSHPSDGKFIGNDDPPSVVERIRNDQYPGLFPTPEFEILPRIPTKALPIILKRIFAKSLSSDAKNRPSLASVGKAIDGLVNHLEQCSVVESHWFDSREKKCSWCEYNSQEGSVDPWGPRKTPKRTLPKQSSLPNVDFSDSNQPPTQARRAPAGQPIPSKRSSSPSVNSASRVSVPMTPRVPTGGPGLPSNFPTTGHVPNPSTPVSAPQVSSPNISPPSPSAIPKKIKGKSVLIASDGSYDVRPPLGQLFRVNPRLAMQCFFDEIPKRAQFWWSGSRPVVSKAGLVFGFLTGALVAFLWFILLPKLVNFVPEEMLWGQIGINIAAISAAATSIFATFVLCMTALLDRRKALKNISNGQTLKEESSVSTWGQFFSVSIIYGAPFVVIIAAMFLLLILKITFSVFMRDQRSRHYRGGARGKNTFF